MSRKWKIRVAVLGLLVAIMAAGVIYSRRPSDSRLVTDEMLSLVKPGMREDELAELFGSPGLPVEFVKDAQGDYNLEAPGFRQAFSPALVHNPDVIFRQWRADGHTFVYFFRQGRIEGAFSYDSSPPKDVSWLDRIAGSLPGWR